MPDDALSDANIARMTQPANVRRAASIVGQNLADLPEVQPVDVPPIPTLGGTTPADFAAFGEEAAERSKVKAEGYRRMRLAEWLEGHEADPIDSASILIQEGKVTTPSYFSTYDQILTRSGRYGVCHTRAEQMGGYLAGLSDDVSKATGIDLPWLAVKLRDCGRLLIFRGYPDANNETRLHAGHFCQLHLLCPLCALRRAAKVLRAYCGKLLQVVRDNGGWCYLVTFTVRNGSDLAERINHLQTALRKLHQRRNRYIAWQDGKGGKPRQFTQGAHAVGALWSYEIKRGTTSGLWHPHAHAVWVCKDRPDGQALANEWRELTGDSHVVDVRPFQSELVDDAELALTALGGDLAEVVKYALKMADLTLSDNFDAYRLLRGKRLVGTFGALRGVEVDPSNLDAPLEPDDLPYLEFVARWVDDRSAYDVQRGDGDTWAGPGAAIASPMERASDESGMADVRDGQPLGKLAAVDGSTHQQTLRGTA
ncbi:MAG: hypothetical protein WD151_15120 [Phycisphaeraceae bacterium]